MNALLETHSLGELAAGANREHLRCEQAYGSAIEHAFRAGEYLIAAKEEVAFGEWKRWVEANFLAGYRTAASYMQLARTGDVQRVAHLGLREALREIATPREPEQPETDGDAEPTEPTPSVFDQLRGVDLSSAEESLRKEKARAKAAGFPRTGVERKTFREIRDGIGAAERWLDVTKRRDASDWSRAEALVAAAKELREASELAAELAALVRG